MINQMETVKTILAGIYPILKCPIIKSNITTKRPDYPFVTFTVTSISLPEKGTNGRIGQGKYINWTEQMWSFSIISDNEYEAIKISEILYEWFKQTGIVYLSDHRIAVRFLSGIACRDNILSNFYEYKKGFDVKFGFVNQVEFDEELIETVDL